MAYLVAVSGGVDSVVLLDVMAAQATEPLIVAHVDHGIRGEASAADARFVLRGGSFLQDGDVVRVVDGE